VNGAGAFDAVDTEMISDDTKPAVDPHSILALENYEPAQACAILASCIELECTEVEHEVICNMIDIEMCRNSRYWPLSGSEVIGEAFRKASIRDRLEIVDKAMHVIEHDHDCDPTTCPSRRNSRKEDALWRLSLALYRELGRLNDQKHRIRDSYRLACRKISKWKSRFFGLQKAVIEYQHLGKVIEDSEAAQEQLMEDIDDRYLCYNQAESESVGGTFGANILDGASGDEM
jgi:hypothetical protein